MSEAIEKYRSLEKVEETDDLSGLFDDGAGEVGENGKGKTKEKELTPEWVARVWEKLSDIEKKFVTCDQGQFDSIMPEYENKHGQNKSGIIRALRKLILAGDPRAGLIGQQAREG